MSLFKPKNKPTMKDLEKQGAVMKSEPERSVEEIEQELADAQLRETKTKETPVRKETPEPPKPMTEEHTAKGFTVPKFPNNENLSKPDKEPEKEVTLEHIANLVDHNYLTLNEAYQNLINRLDLMETRLRTDQDTINDTWKLIHEIKEQLSTEEDDSKKEKEPKKDSKQSKEKKS